MTALTNATREARTPLSRERVLRTAIDLADAGGIESLSMRRLAQELGVEAMSLYHWFARKDDLLGGMLDAVYAEMERPGNGSDWRADIRRSATSTRDVLLRHAWACRLLMSPSHPTPARLQWMNSMLGRLRGAGFSPEMTHHAYHALDSHVVGFVLWVLPYIAMTKDRPNRPDEFMATVPLAELPHLAEHIQQHLDDRPGDTSEFEFGLDLVLDGLERLRRAERPKRR